jgi:hypothetical protein
MVVTSSSIAVKKSVFDIVGVFKLGISYGEDVDLWCRIASKFDVAFSKKICVKYFKDVPNSATSKQIEVDFPFINEYSSYLSQFTSKNRYYLREYINKLQLIKAFWAILHNDKRLAKINLIASGGTKYFKYRLFVYWVVYLIPYPIYMFYRKLKNRFLI